MEKRNLKISFAKSGNGIGAKLSLPIQLLRKIGIDSENREIELILDEKNNSLIIKKRD